MYRARYIVPVMMLVVILLSTGTALGDGQSSVTTTDLANIRDIGGHAHGAISISPDGRWVAFQLQTPKLSEGAYELSWMTVSTHDGRAFHIANGGDILLNPRLLHRTNGNRPGLQAQWSPDSKWFAYLVRQNGETQVWQSRPNRKGRTQLTHNAADVIDFAWSPDGSRLYFETGLDSTKVLMQLEDEGARGFLFDSRFETTISRQPIQRRCGAAVDPFASHVSLARPCEPSVWVYELKSQTERPATKEEIAVYTSLRSELNSHGERPATQKELILSRDRPIKKLRRWETSNRYAWLENEDPETYPGWYAPLTLHALIDGTTYRCAKRVCRGYNIREHQALWWRQDGREVVFLRWDGPSRSMTGLYAWAPAIGEVRRIFQSDDWLSDCAPAGDRLICLHESWTQPRKIVSLSLADGAVTTLYDPNPEFANHRFSKIEKMEWEDNFGNATHGHLVYPIHYDSGRVYPLVIVTYHSRGFLRGGVGDEYPIHPLAAEGFFVLSQEMPFDLENTAKVEESNAFLFEDLYMRQSVLSSQERIVNVLTSRRMIDPKRVALTGLSEGAAQTTYGLIHSDAFATAIASGAAFSPSSYYLMSARSRSWWRSLLNGAPDNSASYYRELSIGLNAESVHAPLLINVSDQELLSTVENFVRLQDAKKPVEMYVYPGEYHTKWRPDHRLAIYRRNIQWLEFWLMGEEVDDPIDPDQYARWRKMRDEQCERLKSDKTPPSYCRQ